jgi:hypothetical protein
MARWFTNAVVVVTMAAVVSAAAAAVPAGFKFAGTSPIQITPGTPVEIPITVTGSGVVQGMSLYVETSGAPFKIDDLLVDNAGTVWTTTGTATSTGAQVFTYAKTQATNDGQITNPHFAASYVTAVSTITVDPGMYLAKVVVSVPVGTPVGTLGTLGTISPTWGDIPSDFVDPAAQGSIGLKVVPEPATALMLLGVLPLIRRRKA